MEASKSPGMRTEPPRETKRRRRPLADLTNSVATEPPREAKRRRRPLADLTNSVASSQSSCSSAITKPLKAPASSSVAPPVRTTRQQTKLSVLEADFVGVRNSENPSSAPLSPPPTGIGRDLNLERSVYGRRTAPVGAKRKSTEKEMVHPFDSSVPRLNNPDFGTGNDDKGVQSLKPHSVPHNKQQKRRKATSKDDTSAHCIPQDFIDQQKKYFEEVDAFPLSEEEVSSDELE